jgi:hypothetical protein
MNNRVPRIAKFRMYDIPKTRKEKADPNDISRANMSFEELGELLSQGLTSVPVIPKDMETTEVQEATGWSTDDFPGFGDTSAIAHDLDSSILQEETEKDTGESEGQQEAAENSHSRMTPVVARKAVQSTKTPATTKPTRPMKQASLEAAVAKGQAKAKADMVEKPRSQTVNKGSTETMKVFQTSNEMEKMIAGVSSLAAAAAAGTSKPTTIQPETNSEISSLAAAAASGRAFPSSADKGSYLGAALGGQEIKALTPAQMIASSTSYLPPIDKGSKILYVETVTKPGATVVSPASVPVAERVQRIEHESANKEVTGGLNNAAAPKPPTATTEERMEIKESPTNQDQNATDMVEEQEDEFHLVGSLFKVYNKHKPTRKHMFRYDIKLEVPPCEPAAALSELSKVLVSIWTAIRDADKKLVIYPWKDGSTYAPLQMIKDMQQHSQTSRDTLIGRYHARMEARRISVFI